MIVALIIVFAIGYVLGYAVSCLFRYTKRSHDDCDERRRSYEQVNFPFIPDTVRHKKEYIANSRGMLLYRQQFIPNNDNKIKGIIGICHGFTDHNNVLTAELAIKLCLNNYIVLCMDYEGHGFSDGMHCYIENLNNDIAGDVSDYYLSILLDSNNNYQNLPFFLFSESMGGAIAYYLSTSHDISKYITGVVMACPMVKVSDELKPPDFVVEILRFLANYFPYAPIVPVPDIASQSFKRKEVLEKVQKCPLSYRQKPRLRTGIACIDATDEINENMEQFTHPILIVHGEADKVTCPKISQTFFERCSSKDKTIKLYPGAWHNLIHGEPDEVSSQILSDVIEWMDARCV